MIVSVDVGTSMTKASIIDHDGRAVAAASIRTTLWTDGQGRVEQDIDAVLAAVAHVVRECMAGADGLPRPEALSITGQGDGMWLRRADGSAPCRAISWMDARATSIVEDWRTDGTLAAVFERTGSALFPGSQGALLAWFARHEPEVLDQAAVAGYCIDTVVHRLCGVIGIDASDASLPFLNVVTREYDPRALELCGVAAYRRLLAQPARPGTTYPLSPAGAHLLGLPAGLPVFAAPYDLVTSTVGVGARAEGEGSVILGTTLGCQVWTSHGPAPAPAGSTGAGMWIAVPDDGLFLRALPSMVGTASIEWMLALLNRGIADLDDLLTSPAEPREVPLTVLPFLSFAGERAPFVNPHARGQISGLTIGTTPGELIRSLCEGIAYVARHCLEDAGLAGDVFGAGGGFTSPVLAQLFADVLGAPLHLSAATGGGERGAAIYAYEALGHPVDQELWRRGERMLVPDSVRSAAYRSGYERYRAQVAAQYA